jgi:hypothetical protein
MITLDTINASLHSVAISDGTYTLAIDSNGAIKAVVSASDLDIRDLAHATDSVEAFQGGTWTVGIDGVVETVPGGYASWKASAQAVTSTATQITATPLTGRLAVEIQNLGSKDIFIGPTNAVTTGSGLKISGGSSQSIELDAGATIWGITASGTADVRIGEYAA